MACRALWNLETYKYNWFDSTSPAPARHGRVGAMFWLKSFEEKSFGKMITWTLYETSLHTLEPTSDSSRHRMRWHCARPLRPTLASLGAPACIWAGTLFDPRPSADLKVVVLKRAVVCCLEGRCLLQGKGILTLKVMTVPAKLFHQTSSHVEVGWQNTLVWDTYGCISTLKHWYHYIRKGALPNMHPLGAVSLGWSVLTYNTFYFPLGFPSLHHHTGYLIQIQPRKE